MKKILCFLIICLLIYTIYYFNHTDKINYLSLGDSLSVGIDSNGHTNYGYSNYIAKYLKEKKLLKSYNNDFSLSGTRITDLLTQLTTNKTITKDGTSSITSEDQIIDYEITYSANATEWNTYTINMPAIQAGAGIHINADYHFYGVYPATDEQVPDFTLRFASLLGDAKEVKGSTKYSNNVTREVIFTDEDFTLKDALDDKFYLFAGVKDDGNIDSREEMNRRQGFEEGTEGFEIGWLLAEDAKITVKDMNGKVIGIADDVTNTVIRGKADSDNDGTPDGETTPAAANAKLVENTNTKTRAWQPGDNDANKVIVTDLPAVEADKGKGYAAIPGGIMIQLPKSIGTTEPVTIEFELKDVFGVTKTVSVVVTAAK